MPRDKAWKPFSRLRDWAPTETSEGIRKTKRSTPHTIAIAIPSARTAPSANSKETSYCSPRQVTSTTPGLFASHVRPPATSASAARKISRRTIVTPLQNAKRAPESAGRPAARTSRFLAAREPTDRCFADRLKRRLRRLPRAGQRRPVTSRLARRFGELIERSKGRADLAAPGCGLDLGHQSLRIVSRRLVEFTHLHEIVEMGEETIRHAARVRLRRRGQDVRRNRVERGRQRAVRGRPVDHGFQRRQRRSIDPKTLHGGELGCKSRAGAQPFFRNLGDDGDGSGVIGGRGLLGGDTRLSLGRGKSALDLLHSGSEGREIGAGGARLWRVGFELRDPRRQFRELALLGVDVRAQVLGLSRQTLGRFASGAIPGADRFQRRHPLVEVRRVGRSGAGLERADPLFERSDGRALAIGLGAECVVRLSRLGFESAQSIPGVRPVGFGGQKRIAGAEAERRNDEPAHRAGKQTPSASARSGFCRGTCVSARFGGCLIGRRVAILRFARGDFSFNHLRLAPGVPTYRRTRWPTGNVLYFLVDHRLALSVFSRALYTGRPERREPAELFAQPSEKPRFIRRFGNRDAVCADCLQRRCNVARHANMLKLKETGFHAG